MISGDFERTGLANQCRQKEERQKFAGSEEEEERGTVSCASWQYELVVMRCALCKRLHFRPRRGTAPVVRERPFVWRMFSTACRLTNTLRVSPQTEIRSTILRVTCFYRLHLANHYSRCCSLTNSHQGGIHLVGRMCFFLRVVSTVVGLTSSTRAVSRMPLPFSAIPTICRLTSGSRPVL